MPQRDPAVWVVVGTSVSGEPLTAASWRVLHEVHDGEGDFDARREWREFLFAAPAALRSVAIIIKRVKGGIFADALQIGHLRVLGSLGTAGETAAPLARPSWACTMCTLVNDPQADYCDACENPRYGNAL